MSKLIFAAFLLFAAFNAWAEEPLKPEPSCRREDGRVSCSEEGFKTLTDALIQYRAAEEKWSLRHTACVTTREAAETGLSSCEAGRKLAEDKLASIKQPGPLRPVLAVTAAVLGAVALSGAFVMTDLPPQLRLGLGAGGVLALTGSYVFVLPEKLEK